MGQCWTGVSDPKLVEAEKELLGFSGIPYENYRLENIKIDEKDNYLRTISCGDPKN
jgi:hypothetical protein